MKIEIKKFEELNVKELYEILKIRSEIFVVEQECVYNDVDGKDLEAIHIMIKEDSKIKAYIRVLKEGVSYDNPSIGRVVVTKDSRGKGYARTILLEGIKYIDENFQKKDITIGAQEYLKDFYGSLGFKGITEVYDEDGIPHLDMTYKK